MDTLESLDMEMAASNLDIAIDMSKDLLNEPLDTTNSLEVFSRANKSCTLSRFIHMNIWQVLTPKEIVVEIIKNVLEPSQKQVDSLSKEHCLGPNQCPDVNRCSKNIRSRINNLQLKYLSDLPSAFSPGQVDPPAV